MALETGSVVNDLVTTNPTASDAKSQGDDHLRLIKSALKNSFPGFTGAVLAGGASTGVANAYVLSATLPSYTANTVVVFTPNVANTGATTININSLGLVYIKRVDGTDLQLNDLLVGQYAVMAYTGTEFRLLGATKGYIDNLAFNVALPAQTGNAGKLITTDGATASWTNTPTLSSINGGQLAGLRNRIINGGMVIDQRNAGASVTTIDGTTYSVDRWRTPLTQASKYSVQQNAGSVTPPVGFSKYLGATSLSAYSVLTGDIFCLSQTIEGLNIADLAWGTVNASSVTVSFKVYSSLTGTFGGGVQNSGTTRSYPFSYSIPVANTWTIISITIAGDTSGTWLTTNGTGITLNLGLGGGATFSGTSGSWAGSDYRTATGATSVVGTSGATFYITGVQLEKGSVATPFEQRPYGMELALCQRYYYRVFPGVANGMLSPSAYAGAATSANCAIKTPVSLRVAPSALEQSGTAANYSVVFAGGLFNCTAVPILANCTTEIVMASFTVASGLTLGWAGAGISSVASGQLAYLGWSAEL
jgi:hypothetical protein